MINGHDEKESIDWRYLPYIRPMFQAYGSENIPLKDGQTCGPVPPFWDPESFPLTGVSFKVSLRGNSAMNGGSCPIFHDQRVNVGIWDDSANEHGSSSEQK